MHTVEFEKQLKGKERRLKSKNEWHKKEVRSWRRHHGVHKWSDSVETSDSVEINETGFWSLLAGRVWLVTSTPGSFECEIMRWGTETWGIKSLRHLLCRHTPPIILFFEFQKFQHLYSRIYIIWRDSKHCKDSLKILTLRQCKKSITQWWWVVLLLPPRQPNPKVRYKWWFWRWLSSHDDDDVDTYTRWNGQEKSICMYIYITKNIHVTAIHSGSENFSSRSKSY